MNATMHYYIAKSVNSEQYGHLTNLTKRFDTLAAAQDYLRKKIQSWQAAGLNIVRFFDNGTNTDLWGAQACNADWWVVGDYKIFATPVFMAGGKEGL